MSQLKSTERIDELFKKGQDEGLNDREKAELLFLLESQGLRLVRLIDIESESKYAH